MWSRGSVYRRGVANDPLAGTAIAVSRRHGFGLTVGDGVGLGVRLGCGWGVRDGEGDGVGCGPLLVFGMCTLRTVSVAT